MHTEKADQGGQVQNGSAPTVLVFTTVILPYSQTFIRDHVAYLRRYRPILVGFKKVDGLDLGDLTTATIATNPLARWLLYWLGISPELDRLVRANNAALVHAHFLDGGALIARYCARRRLPLITTIHGSDILRERAPTAASRLRDQLHRSALKTTTRFLAVSDWLLRQAVAKGVPATQVERHYLGIPVATGEPAEREGEPATILFVGRLVEKKGLLFLMEALRLLSVRGKPYRCRIVGAGELRERLETMARESNLPVTFTGSLPSDVVREEMDRADIFCMPSTAAADGDNEGLGLVFVEAESHGLPVVSFDQGPIPEAVAKGETGLLVEDRNVEALADALAGLLDDPVLRRRMGVAGRVLVENRFDIVQQSRALETIYDRVVGATTR